MSDDVGTPPSRRRWLIVALAVSVALNLFIVGAVVGHFHRDRPSLGLRERFDHIVAGLDLNDAQRAAFQNFQTTMRVHGAAMRTANTAAWAKIADPATKPDEIPALLNETVKTRTEFQIEAATAMGKFLATLTPDQRASFIEKARWPGHHRR